MNQIKSGCITLLAFMLLIGYHATSYAAADTKTLRIGLISAESHPVTKAAKKMAEIVEKNSQGALTIKVFPGGALGGNADLPDMVTTGTLDMTSVGTPMLAAKNPQFKILTMPYLWDSPEQMIAFSNSTIQSEMNQQYLKKSKARILASNWYQGTRHTLSKKPINNIGDFKGLKIRVPQLPEWVEMWKRLGANPTQIAFPEVYSALQQGVVDAMECPLFYFYSSSFYEQAKNIVLTAHNIYSNSVIINDKTFQKLSEAHQKILLDAAKEAGEYETKLTLDADKDLYEKLKAAGVTFTQLKNDEIAQLIRPVYDSWTKVFGADLLEKVDAFKADYNKQD